MVLDKKTKSWLFVGAAVLVILVLILIFSPSSSENPSNKETVKIGVTLPLTGDIAFLGIPDKNAVEMAKDDFAANSKYDYKLFFEDDSYDSKKVTSNLQKFTNIDNVDVVTSLGSMPANIIAPIAQEKDFVYTAFSASDTTVTKDHPYVFDFTTTPRKESERMIQELVKRGYSNISIARTNMDFTQAISEELKKQAPGAGITIVSDQVYNLGETDFKTGILKLQEAKPQIIVVLMQPPEIDLFAKQYKEANTGIPITSIESFGLTDQKSLFEGMWYVDAGYPDSVFIQEYKNKFGEEPGQYAADAYSTMKILITTYESFDKKPTSAELSAKLMSIKDFDTPLGKVSVNGDGVFETPATLKQIKNGEPVLIS